MTLTAQDVADLDAIEERIEKNQAAFFQMADDLLTIRDRKLYLREYKTFEAYCQNRWGWTRQWVNQQIRSAEVVRRLPEKTVETLVSKAVSPLTETLARAVASIPEEKRAEVIQHAAAKPEPITAASISESAKTVATPAPLETPKEQPKRRDETGWVIPESRLPLFDRASLFDRFLAKLADVRGFVRRMQDAPDDPLFRETNTQEMLLGCDNLYAQLKLCIPYAVCPVCQGIKFEDCTACLRRGVMSQHRWDNAVPLDLKEIRRKTLEDEK